jgi:DNA invertase Pin-like site-specific DNA recombinase
MILAYCRVSTEEQRDGTSLDEQERKCRAIATLRGAGPYDVAVFNDGGVSGSVPLADRPAGREMLATAKANDVVVASKLDRVFRNVLDALQALRDLKERGIDLILADLSPEPITGNGVGKMMFTMLAMVAEFERDRINVRTAEGRRAKKLKGGLVGGPPPYGFSVEGRGKESMLVPNPAEQEPVRLILDLSKEMRPYRLMKELEARGYRNRCGKPFDLMQIKRIAKYHGEQHAG